jgi:hypothetical protein
MKYYTYKKDVPLGPGQVIGFTPGKGYYAKTVRRRPKPAPPSGPPTAGQLALKEALRHVGLTESPAGSNRQPFGAWFGENGVPWCAIFVSYCLTVAGDFVMCKDYQGPGVVAGKGCAYVPTVESWAKDTGRWQLPGSEGVEPGWLAVYNWDGGVPDHMGIVQSVGPGSSFTAVEGNTAVGRDSNGGEVMVRDRARASLDGWVRV